MVFKNYGDHDFFQHGRLVDSDHSDTEFRILFCNPYDDLNENGKEHFQFGEVTVDTTDSWIDKQAVMSYIGMKTDDYDAIQFALGCLDYYGAENFGVESYSCKYDWQDCTEEEIVKELDGYCIATDNLDMSWSKKRSA